MHEMKVTESLLVISLRYADNANVGHITALNIVIGQISSIIDDSIQFYWDILARGTKAEGALLNFHRIPTQFTCQDCSFVFKPQTDSFYCPQCNSSNIKLTAGTEFFLESIEVEN